MSNGSFWTTYSQVLQAQEHRSRFTTQLISHTLALKRTSPVIHNIVTRPEINALRGGATQLQH